MRGALDETIADARVRDAIYERMAGLADWMRNRPGNPHDARQDR
jgi:truncated hemoglobin YjbI